MEKINISYINLGTYNDNGEVKPVLPTNGSKLKIVDLKTAWISQIGFSPDAPKGTNGMIFPFAFDTFYDIDYIREQNLCNNGVLFVDIDCGEDLVERIFQDMGKYNEILSNTILGAAKTRKGLHVLFRCQPQTDAGFRLKVFYKLTSLAWVINKVTGIDLREIPGALDTCTFSIKQRLFLRHSKPIFWNDDCLIGEERPEDKKRLVEEYKALYDKVNGFKDFDKYKDSQKSTTFELEGIVEVGMQPYIEHRLRWRLFDSLCCLFADNPDELKQQWERCCDFITPENHPAAFFKAEPDKNGWFGIWQDKSYKWADEDLLKQYGYVIKSKTTLWCPNIDDVEKVDKLLGLDINNIA